jgi:hypothetical protein
MPAGLGGWAADTLALYVRVLRRAAVLALRNWWVGLVVIVYGRLLWLIERLPLPGPLAIVGGLLAYVATVACASSWLYLVEQVIRSGRVRLADVRAGFAAYLGDLLTIAFVLFLVSLAYQVLLANNAFGQIVVGLALVVFLNAVPELVYLGRHGPAELLAESYRFISTNWIEWFPPNIALGIAIAALADAGGHGLALVPDPLLAFALSLVVNAVVALAAYFFMIVRGLLFLELTTSSRRAREFQRRAAG